MRLSAYVSEELQNEIKALLVKHQSYSNLITELLILGLEAKKQQEKGGK